jgi:hypothetical protein
MSSLEIRLAQHHRSLRRRTLLRLLREAGLVAFFVVVAIVAAAGFLARAGGVG